MKRHLDLYRTLLLELEMNGPGLGFREFEAEDYEEQQVLEHLKLLMDADYVEGNYSLDGVGAVNNAWARGLTPEGHDFLQGIRDDTVWARTKERIQQMTGTTAIAVMKKVAIDVAEKLYG